MNSPTPPVEDVLTPCPFCGANEEGFRRGKTGCPLVEELTEGGWRVTCYTCRYSICWKPFPTRRDAIAAWNTRADAKVIEALRTDLQRAREALEWVANHAAKLRQGTDDWFELVEVEHIARSTLNTISSGPDQ